MKSESNPANRQDPSDPGAVFSPEKLFSGEGLTLSELGSNIQRGLVLRQTLYEDNMLPASDPKKMSDGKREEFNRAIETTAEELGLPVDNEYWSGVQLYFKNAVAEREGVLRSDYPIIPGNLAVPSRPRVKGRVGTFIGTVKEIVAVLPLPRSAAIFNATHPIDTQPEAVRIKLK